MARSLVDGAAALALARRAHAGDVALPSSSSSSAADALPRAPEWAAALGPSMTCCTGCTSERSPCYLTTRDFRYTCVTAAR